MGRFFSNLLSVLALCASAVWAGPLDRGHVPSEAKWLVHIDMEQLHANPTVTFLRQKLLDRPDVKKNLAVLNQELGFDPIKGLRGMTLYGYDHTEGKGAVLVDAVADVDKCVAKVSKQADHRSFKHGAHQLHAWTTAERRRIDGVKVAAEPVVWTVHPNGLHVYASDDATARKVLDLLDGKSMALAKKSGGLTAKLPERCILYLEAVELEKAPKKQEFQAQSLVVSVHQNDAELFIRSGMVAQKAEEAERVEKWLTGLKLIFEAQIVADQPQAAQFKKMMDRIKFVRDDKTLSVSFGLKHEAVTDRIKQWLAQRRKARGAADLGKVQ